MFSTKFRRLGLLLTSFFSYFFENVDLSGLVLVLPAVYEYGWSALLYVL